MANPNIIKTSNKLIGEIENKELYDSDDDLPDSHETMDYNQQNILYEELDLGENK